MKSYLLSYSQACTPEQVQYVLDDTQAVETWVTPFPYAAILVSKLGVGDLSAVIRDRIPGVWFMVTELNGGGARGWLPGNLWEYVNDPRKAWSRKLFSGLSPHPPRPTGLASALLYPRSSDGSRPPREASPRGAAAVAEPFPKEEITGKGGWKGWRKVALGPRG